MVMITLGKYSILRKRVGTSVARWWGDTECGVQELSYKSNDYWIQSGVGKIG